jgi:hypothetical protein
MPLPNPIAVPTSFETEPRQAQMPENLLYYGDNLDILRSHIADDSVDLVYLDPPFNRNASYNVRFHGTGIDMHPLGQVSATSSVFA